jgi:hypothetical protein
MAPNLELAGRVLEAFMADDLAGDPHSTALAEVLREVAAPEFSCSFIAGSSGEMHNDFQGVEGLLDGWADWASAYEQYRIEPDGDPIVAGDAVVGYTRQIATPKGAAQTMETEAAGVLFFSEGELTRLELHLDRDQALRAAGVEASPDTGGG